MGNLEKKITADTDRGKNELLSIPSVHDLDPCTDIVPGCKSSTWIIWKKGSNNFKF